MLSDESKANILNKIEKLAPIAQTLREKDTLKEKIAFLRICLRDSHDISGMRFENALKELVFLSILIIDEEEILREGVEILDPLEKVEQFYESIGGIVGYHLKALQLIVNKEKSPFETNYERPFGYDLRQNGEEKQNHIISGLLQAHLMGEIFLVGGLGDRLKLENAAGEPLPAALLPFCGKSLLEILLRDLMGREYLFYKLFAKRVITPVALMTSHEKGNHRYITNTLKEKNYFGRGEKSFFVFPQISVPVVAENGRWVMKNPKELLLYPGGHGALWKACLDEGVFQWFHKLRKKAFLIRQINNPIAGIDSGLIALIGIGQSSEKTLGIASCERLVSAAEGMLVEVEKEKGHFATINIEYTDFQQHNIEDRPDEKGYSVFPANTNILYVDLNKITQVVKQHPLPEFLLNMKTKIGNLWAGRLESMVQNISHFLVGTNRKNLPTFVTYNERGKTISTAKRAFEGGRDLLETPEGAFYDILQEGYHLLKKECKVVMPPFSSKENYLRYGPSLQFLYHPALGPLFEIIAQKIVKGKIGNNSELQCEIAELLLENINLQGSLLIEAEDVCGKEAGRCFLRNIAIKNQGIDRTALNVFWKNQIARKEKLKIYLGKNAEFIAEDLTFVGERTIMVPQNKRWIAYEERGEILFYETETEEKTEWTYILENKKIKLSHAAYHNFALPSR